MSVQQPDPRHQGVLVLDEDALDRLPLPLIAPERVVLISDKNPQHLSRAWDAGIVSLVTFQDPPATVLLAIMAAALRVPKMLAATAVGGISPTGAPSSAPITPHSQPPAPRRPKQSQ
ncbi:MAG: hypothetical protein ACE15B_09465 [Bryobacteraceae bacterium]